MLLLQMGKENTEALQRGEVVWAPQYNPHALLEEPPSTSVLAASSKS